MKHATVTIKKRANVTTYILKRRDLEVKALFENTTTIVPVIMFARLRSTYSTGGANQEIELEKKV